MNNGTEFKPIADLKVGEYFISEGRTYQKIGEVGAELGNYANCKPMNGESQACPFWYEISVEAAK